MLTRPSESAPAGPTYAAYGPPTCPVQPAGAANVTWIGKTPEVTYRIVGSSGVSPAETTAFGVGVGLGVGLTMGVGTAPTLFSSGPRLIHASATATRAAAAINALLRAFMSIGLHGTGSTRSCRVVRTARRTASTALGGVTSEPASSHLVVARRNSRSSVMSLMPGAPPGAGVGRAPRRT